MLPPMIPTLEAHPVRLRSFDFRDEAVVLAASVDPLIPLITSVPSTPSSSGARAYIQRQRGRLTQGMGYSFTIADLHTDKAVGQIGLWTGEWVKGRSTIGYWIAPLHRGHGYAQAALSLLVDWCSDKEELHRLQLFVEPHNLASQRVAEACGFQREGLLREWEKIGDSYRDVYAYSLILER